MLPVVFFPGVEKYFKKLKDRALANVFKEAVIRIRKNPEIGEAKKGDLAGIFCLDIHYSKTNYELAYRLVRLEDGQVIVIIMAGTRENFYKELKRYLR